MREPVVVFDFDKTLTDRDTIFGFYSHVNEKNITFTIKRILLLIAALMYKIGIINNNKLKQFGVKLFLKGMSKESLKEKAYQYARGIKLNQIYYGHFLNTPKDERVIISASFEIYLEKIFPDEKVIGSKLDYNEEKVIGLKRNMFGKTKKLYLLNKGIKSIDCLFTDSYSDKPVMDMAKRIMHVKDGTVSELATSKGN